MASYDQVMNALRNAHSAGDTEAAQRLAGIAAKLKQQQAQPVEQPGQPSSIVDKFFGALTPKAEVGIATNPQVLQDIGNTTGEFATKNAPDIGAAIGGTVALAGSPVAAPFGAGVGAGIGSAIQQKFQKPSDQFSMVEVGSEAGKAAAFEAVGGLLFKGVSTIAPSIKTVFLDKFERARAKYAMDTSEFVEGYAKKRGMQMTVPFGRPLDKGLEEASEIVDQATELAFKELDGIIANKGREAAADTVSGIVEAGNNSLQLLYGDGLKKVGLEKFAVDTAPLAQSITQGIEDLAKKGVVTQDLYKSPEANAFVKKILSETQESGKVSADVFESRYISEAKAIQRQAELAKNGQLVGEMKEVIGKLENSLETSVKAQKGEAELTALKNLRKTYSDNINNLNLKVYRKLADDPTRLYAVIKDSKTAKDFANAMRSANKLNPTAVPKEKVDIAVKEAASILMEKRLGNSLDLTKGNVTAQDLKQLNKNLSRIVNDKEFIGTLNAMGAGAQYKDIKALSRYTEAMTERLYKNRGILADTRQLATDATLAATVGSAYALTRMLAFSVPWVAKRAESLASVRRWQNRVASGEIAGDAAVKLAKQMVGNDFADYLNERGMQEGE